MPLPLWYPHAAIPTYYRLRKVPKDPDKPIPMRRNAPPPNGGLVAQEGGFTSIMKDFQLSKRLLLPCNGFHLQHCHNRIHIHVLFEQVRKHIIRIGSHPGEWCE